MKFYVIPKYILICSIVIFTACSFQNRKPILLGAIYNLHGSQASLDIASAHGAELAVSKINSTGGINGHPIHLILKDGYSNPDSIIIATKSLLKQKVVTIIGFSDTDMVLAAGSLISQAGIPFITSGATAPILVKRVPNVLFLSCFGDNVQAAAGAEFAKTQMNTNRVFIIYDKNMDYAKYLVQYFKQSWMDLRGGFIAETTYGGNPADSVKVIQMLKKNKKGFDLIYLASGPDDVGNWIKLIRKAGINQPILGGDGYDTPLLLKNSGNYADNIYFTTHAWMSKNGSHNGMNEFFTSYHEKFGTDPENSFAALGYDAVMLFADAAKRSKRIKPSFILSAIENTSDLKGLTGKVKYIDGSHIPMKEVMIEGIKNGKYYLEAVIAPEKIPNP
jgi:branched-chain amino acid transport system substrate-binding protein